MPRIGLGGSQWFDYEYDSTNDALVISRNAEANGSVVIRNQDVNIEGALASTSLVVNNGITAGTVNVTTFACSGAVKGTSFTVGANAGITGSCANTVILAVQGGIIVATG